MSNKILKLDRFILLFLLLFMIIEKFIFGFTLVKGMSMKPTLDNNDKLFINKIAYRLRKPHIGDIVIFHPPIAERKDELFIKRIIAIEGDVFSIEQGKLYINGMRMEEPYLKSENYEERLYNMTSGKVPKGMVFVMGDNRNDSNDSRSFGFVPLRDIKGKADLRIWPVHTMRGFFNAAIH